MTAHALPIGPGVPAQQMAQLHGQGFSLLPLGKGADGKSPLLAFSSAQRIPLARVLAPMHRTGSCCYGIRLGGLAVIDCDTDDPALVADMEARFGASPVHVRTPRGRHLYYRADVGTFPNLRGEGLPVDIKRGHSSYVMGPGSVRPDGGEYVPAKGALGMDVLPEIRLASARQPVTRTSGRIETGSRNYALTVAAVQMVETVDDADELFGNLQFIRDDECEDPATLPDGELRKIADWAWSKRLEGKVYHGRSSEFRLSREALDALAGLPNASDAIALFVMLQDQHGHRPAVTFPLDHSAMKAAGRTDLSRERFIAAREALQGAGLIQIAARHVAGKQPRTYRLARLRPAAANVTMLHHPHRPQQKGEGV
ncbi:bifunctional DNA primase/polymerase [Limimaricola variabilis]|uniref:bifunctional DNA primase/polymerase n=1 Tax=Limimaricola variabilis TaxID=1492771 RepID=UPI002AC9AC1D|nr:bifunctional DNA primase/polymerase [Limimaricola variabilis]WPY94226.1 bifunctional DNA primase/polymerase [Limimaricola variabilis]